MFHVKILHQNLRHSSFWVPRSASSSHTISCWSLLISAYTHSTFLGVLLVAGLPILDHFQQILDHLWSICATLSFVLLSSHIPESLLNHPNSLCGGMFKLKAIFNAVSLLYSPIHLNVTPTQYTYSLNGFYCPHWLIQWSWHCSCVCIPVYSPWLPGYFDVAQTVLIILTMVGLFTDRHNDLKLLHHGFQE